MGSDSDWSVMEDAAQALAEFDVPFEVGVVFAHRTPGRMLDYARTAAGRGIEVIIAGAGGAAHLPGMVASATPLPVIGVPVPLAKLDGLDSLLSIVQMPAGVPVATVSIGGATRDCWRCAFSARRTSPCGRGWRNFRAPWPTWCCKRMRRCETGCSGSRPPTGAAKLRSIPQGAKDILHKSQLARSPYHSTYRQMVRGLQVVCDGKSKVTRE
jgi:phosphoribosylaminoimidazole carboxylase PurE protein